VSTELESSIEKKVVAYAKAQDVMVRKMNGMSYAGWPDRLMITPSGRHFYIEFKRPGGKLSPRQEALIGELRARSVVVYVVDDAGRGKAIIDAELTV
jgi:hypothetical protein